MVLSVSGPLPLQLRRKLLRQRPLPEDMSKLRRCYDVLISEAQPALMANTRIGNLAMVDKLMLAHEVADHIGGKEGAVRSADAYQALSGRLFTLGDNAGAAWAACSALRAARTWRHRSMLIAAPTSCGDAARKAPAEMVNAERESREQEVVSGSPCLGDLDLSQEGRISLPTTPAALTRLALAYNEAAVDCDAALAAAGGDRGSFDNDDDWRVPSLHVEARARSCLGDWRLLG